MRTRLWLVAVVSAALVFIATYAAVLSHGAISVIATFMSIVPIVEALRIRTDTKNG
jgi:hypothetical protein